MITYHPAVLIIRLRFVPKWRRRRFSATFSVTQSRTRPAQRAAALSDRQRDLTLVGQWPRAESAAFAWERDRFQVFPLLSRFKTGKETLEPCSGHGICTACGPREPETAHVCSELILEHNICAVRVAEATTHDLKHHFSRARLLHCARADFNEQKDRFLRC